MAIRMQQRKGTAAQWTASNPILNSGEIGYESDTNKFKIGDGTNLWATLPYFLDEDSLDSSLGGYLEDTLLGANNGIAQLNNIGKLVSTQIPNVDEITQDAINTALVAGIGLDKTYDDNGNTITIDIDSTVATLTGTQTLTNKTIDTASNTITGAATLTGTQTLTNKTLTAPVISTITNGAATLTLPTITGTVALTTDLPSGMVTESATQTLTNKTLTSPVVTGLVINDGSIVVEGSVANDFETTLVFTEPTADRTITFPNNSFTVASTADISAATGGSVSETGTQTLTNKTLTEPVINNPTGLTKSNVGLGNVDNTTDALKPVSTATQTALDLKAPLASPALTGVPTAPTAAAATNTTQVATTAYVRAEVAALVNSAGTTLDTLGEIATALGNDANLSTTLTTSIGLKAPIASPTFTGTVSGITKSMVGLGSVDNTADASKPVSTATQTALDLKAPAASPTFTGTITLPQGKLTGGSTTVSANTATTVSTVALADFTTMEYTVSIKQGSKVRSSKVLVQTDGTAVDSVEHSILETGGAIAGINVTAAVASTNAVLRVTVTDAVTTNAAVKVISTII